MVQLYCTQKLLKEFDEVDLEPPKSSKSLMGNWYANLFKIGRHKCLIFVSENTLFSFVVPQVKKENFNNIKTTFIEGLTNALNLLDIDKALIEKICGEYHNNFEISKSNNRKVIGSMNNLVSYYKFMIRDLTDVNNAIIEANSMPQKNLGWFFPRDLLDDLLKKPH